MAPIDASHPVHDTPRSATLPLWFGTFLSSQVTVSYMSVLEFGALSPG